MSTEIYSTNFGSFNGAVWSIEIHRRYADTSETSLVVATNFACGETPAEIEWKQTTRHDSMCGSVCTLHLESPGDGTFTGLYAAAYGDVILKLYRNGTLYWQGALDPEFYSEPFDSSDGYIVDLTFSDLGALKRIDFTRGAGRYESIATLLTRALEAAGYAPAIVESHGIYNGATLVRLSYISIDTDNFFDEDGKAMCWYDVIEGVLKPLALRLVQDADSRFTVYSLIYRFGPGVTPAVIDWAATGQTLGTDKVYKRIEVNYSPYDRGKLSCSIDRDELTFKSTSVTTQVYNSMRQGENVLSFTMEWDHIAQPQKTGFKNILGLGAQVYAAKLTRVYGGEDSAVIREYARLTNDIIEVAGNNYYYSWCEVACSDAWRAHHMGTGTFAAVYLDPMTLTVRPDMLRLKLETLLDVRYNPFETGDNEYNDKDAYKAMKKWKRFAIPMLITLTSFDGSSTYYYRNRTGFNSGWVMYNDLADNHWGECWAYYYGGDSYDKAGEGAAGGWQNNKHYSVPSPSAYINTAREQGQYLSKPPITGTLSIQIGRGALIPEAQVHSSKSDVYRDVRWLLYKSLTVEAVDQYGRNIDGSDIVYSADLDSRAADVLTIDTVCGSTTPKAPTARGVYRFSPLPVDNMAVSTPVDTLWVNMLGKPEALLIAQLASQYAEVSLVLKGQINGGYKFSMITTYNDAYIGGDVRFLCTGAVFDIRRNTVEATLTEIKNISYNIGNVNG